VGTADNNAYASYYKNGKISLRFEVAYIAGDTVIDVDDISVKAKMLSAVRLSKKLLYRKYDMVKRQNIIKIKKNYILFQTAWETGF